MATASLGDELPYASIRLAHAGRVSFWLMNTQDLLRLGVPAGESVRAAHDFIRAYMAQGGEGAGLETEVFHLVADPSAFFADPLRAPFARVLYRPPFTPRAELAPWRQWGEGLEASAVQQMANACALPVAVGGRADARCTRGVRVAHRRGARDREHRDPLRRGRGHRLPHEADRVRPRRQQHRGSA